MSVRLWRSPLLDFTQKWQGSNLLPCLFCFLVPKVFNNPRRGGFQTRPHMARRGCRAPHKKNFPLGGRCRADARRMRGQLWTKLSFAPQGNFCHQTKVTKSWFKNPWFLNISLPQTLWFSPLNTGAEVTATVSAVEPLSRFVRHLFYPVPVSLLRLHRFVTVRFAGRSVPGPYKQPGHLH